MILGALEGKVRSLDTSASTETHQTTAAPSATSRGLGYVNKTESYFFINSVGIKLSTAAVFSCVWKLVMKYSVNIVLGRSIEVLVRDFIHRHATVYLHVFVGRFIVKLTFIFFLIEQLGVIYLT